MEDSLSSIFFDTLIFKILILLTVLPLAKLDNLLEVRLMGWWASRQW